jgi:hypothetical protein
VTSEPTYEPSEHYTGNGRRKPHHAGDPITKASMGIDASVVRTTTTTGWTTCGHPGTDGLRLDGFHDGPGWRPGIVYDPFAGTGTTNSEQTIMGRDAIGADLDSRNADLALERVGPLLLTVEHLDPEHADYVPTEPHNQTGNPRFRDGYVDPKWRPGRNPRVGDYGESA